ncbi:hypothetical protein RAD16_01485 [Bradyrhizobium sp. 18BD]
MANAANCLNLVGDGDDADVLRAVEEAFGVKISAPEALRSETVGQLCAIVSSKLDITAGCGIAKHATASHSTIRHDQIPIV